MESERVYFDWEKAYCEIIKHGARNATAGLLPCWLETMSFILVNGQPFRGSALLSSSWQKPFLKIHFDDGSTLEIPCATTKPQPAVWPEGMPEQVQQWLQPIAGHA